MKQRLPLCKYCGAALTTGTTRKEFCSDKCRVYFNREKAAVAVNNLQSVVVDDVREHPAQQSSPFVDKIQIKVKGNYLDQRRQIKSGGKPG